MADNKTSTSTNVPNGWTVANDTTRQVGAQGTWSDKHDSYLISGYKNSSLKPYDFTKVSDPTGDFFQGTWNFHNDQISQYDPFIGGYAFIYWTRLPDWLDNKAFNTNHMSSSSYNGKDAFKWMTMRNFKSLDGLSDIELGAEAMTAGFTGNELNTVTNITKGNTEFTLKHQELSGSPIRKIYANWVNGLRDMDTGIATYGGKYDMEYSMKNNTGELLYIVTDPSGGTMKNSIEFAAYFTNVFPTRVPYSHLNYTSGEHSLAEIDVPFKGVFHQSIHVDELAAQMLPYITAYRTADQFIPLYDSSSNGQTTFSGVVADLQRVAYDMTSASGSGKTAN